MVSLFEDVVPKGVCNLRMGSPGDTVLLRSAELVKNAAQKVMVRELRFHSSKFHSNPLCIINGLD